MAWQYEIGAGSDRATTYHDFVTKVVAMMTSQKVATVAVNAGGTGWTTGDIATLTHAGAFLDAKFEVTAVAGAITALRIISNGAFSNRFASAVVGSSGGTGYAVGDILEVQGGTAREKGKVQVATLSGSAVATVTVFETGGAYSSAPGASSATTKVGPNAGTGSGCTITPTMTGLIGTTALSVTGAGSGATVDITLAEIGWAVDGRNTNSTSFNGVTNEKEVVLKGDAAGRTNKPYIAFTTFTRTSGVNTRYCIGLHGMIAHNSAIALASQPGMLGNPGTWSDERPYILCDENQIQSMDFWLSVNDYRVCGVLDTNSGAATSDDRQFFHFYAGFYDSFATEVEDPYPMFVGGASRSTNIDPSLSTTSITGLGECISPPSGNFQTGMWYYRSETSTWINVENSESVASQASQHIMFPLGRLLRDQSSPGSDDSVGEGPVGFYSGIGALDRSSPTRRLFPVPGSSSSLFFPIPLTIVSRGNSGGTPNQTLDTVRGNLAGCFWVYNTDAAGATISNYALDYITVGSNRYRIFHTHVQRQLYHYIGILEDV